MTSELHSEAQKRLAGGKVDGVLQWRAGSQGEWGKKAWLGSSRREVAHTRRMSPASES